MHLTGQCNSVPRVCVCVGGGQRNCCIRLCSGVLARERVWGMNVRKSMYGVLCVRI